MVGARGWRTGNGELVFSGYRVSVCEGINDLEIGDDDDCSTM
jgi:hypothetical protein